MFFRQAEEENWLLEQGMLMGSLAGGWSSRFGFLNNNLPRNEISLRRNV